MVKDITGNRYGRLVVLKENGRTKQGKTKWECLCDCGNIKTVAREHLTRGHTKSCGCITEERRVHNFKDRTGEKYNKLTFVKYIGDKKWLFKCECGNTIIARGASITSGKTKSCGCLSRTPKIPDRIGFKINGCEVINKKIRHTGNVMWLIECGAGHIFYAGDKAISSGDLKCNRCERHIKIRNENRTEVMLNREYVKSVKYRHRKKGFDIKGVITYEEFKYIVARPCYYCGKEFSKILRDVEKSRKVQVTNTIVKICGIDRVDSSKGYTIDNVVSCCDICNRMKLDKDITEFFDTIKRIYEKHLK